LSCGNRRCKRSTSVVYDRPVNGQKRQGWPMAAAGDIFIEFFGYN